MSEPEKSVLEFITRLTYNLEGISPRLRLYLSQLLTFHFSKTLSADFIQNIENKKASKGYDSNEQVEEAIKNFSFEQRAWCIATLSLLKDEADLAGNRKLSAKIKTLIEELIGLFDLTDRHQDIADQRRGIEEEVKQFQNRIVIRVPIRIWPLVIDYIIRCSVLLTFSWLAIDKARLIVPNALLIPVLILLLSFVVSRRQRRYDQKLLEKYGGIHKFNIQYVVTASQYTWLAFFLATSVFVSNLLPDQFPAFAFVGLVVYYFICLRFLQIGHIDENELIAQLERETDRSQEYDSDENDEQIVGLETKLNSYTGRLEAYVLESALFGALTFSGFLQIMASDLVSFADLETFATSVFDVVRSAINFDSSGFDAALLQLRKKESLLSLVSVESLICSGFFLAVIASRLRFSDIADKVSTSLNLAKAYNLKEEAILGEGTLPINQDRLKKLMTKVNEQIHNAAASMMKINPVMMYMRYFRNAGILLFFVILVTSSLFITSVLAWSFLTIVLATYVYFNYSRINTAIRAAYLEMRIEFTRRAFWFLVLALSPAAFSLIALGFGFATASGFFLALCYVTLGLYSFIWLMLAAHVDEQFGDIENNKDRSRISRWEVLKGILAVLVLVYGIGNAFKVLNLTGASGMVLVTLNAIAILMYFVGYYLSKIRILGVLSGLALANCMIGILFKTLHLQGADDMVMVGIVGLGVLIPILIWKRKSFHRLFLRIAITVQFIALVWWTSIFSRMEIAVGHHTINVAPIWNVMASNRIDELEDGPTAIREGIKTCNWYIETYGTWPGYALVYRNLATNYEYYIFEEIERQSIEGIDTVKLANARLLGLQANKIHQMFNHTDKDFAISDPVLAIDQFRAKLP